MASTPSSSSRSSYEDLLPLNTTPPLLQSFSIGDSVLAFCCADKKLFCASGNDIQVWNLQTLSLVTTLRTHTGSINALAAAEEHHWLFSSSSDDSVVIWSTRTLTPLHVISTTSCGLGDVYSICWVSELSLLFLGCQDASIVWFSPPGALSDDRMLRPGPNSSSCSSGALTPKRDIPHRFFDSLSAAERARSTLMSPSPSGQGSPSAPASISRSSSGSSLSSLEEHGTRRSPRLLALSSSSAEASPSLQCSASLPVPLGSVSPERSFAPLPSQPSSRSSGGISSMHQKVGPEPLDLDPNACIAYAHNGYIYSILRAHRHGKVILASAGGDGHVCLWVLELGSKKRFSKLSLLKRLNQSDSDQAIFCLAYSEGTLFAGCQGGTIKIWDLETYQCIRTLEAHACDVLSLSMVDGMLFSGAACGEIKRWTSDFRQAQTWRAHHGAVLASIVKRTPIPASSSRPVLLSGGSDKTVKIWHVLQNAESREPVERSKLLEGQLFQMLSDCVAFPTVSSDDRHREDCRKCAHFLQKSFTALGAQADLLPVAPRRNPLLLATFHANKPMSNSKRRKRVMFYGHYDVIAPGKAQEWTSPPFEMSGRDGYLYGRGVADQKGPLLTALLAVAQLHGAQNLPIDAVFVVEGEEECGSVGFQDAIRAHREALGDIDVILVSNSHWMTDQIPSVTWGLRGVVHANIKIQAHTSDVHSGVCGGSVGEPLLDMTRLLSTLVHLDGRIAIPGFYESVRPLEDDELGFYREVIDRTALPLKPGYNKAQELRSLLARWREPSLSLHEIKTSSRNRTVVPSWASTDLSLRIVPDQSLDSICNTLEQHLRGQFENLKSSNQFSFEITQTADWWLANRQAHYGDLLYKTVAEEWPNTKPMWVREGGSIPSIPFLERLLDAPAVHFPMSQSSDAAHLPNERVRVLNLEKAGNILRRWIVKVGQT